MINSALLIYSLIYQLTRNIRGLTKNKFKYAFHRLKCIALDTFLLFSLKDRKAARNVYKGKIII